MTKKYLHFRINKAKSEQNRLINVVKKKSDGIKWLSNAVKYNGQSIAIKCHSVC